MDRETDFANNLAGRNRALCARGGFHCAAAFVADGGNDLENGKAEARQGVQQIVQTIPWRKHTYESWFAHDLHAQDVAVLHLEFHPAHTGEEPLELGIIP